jgi:succinate dehydrogenase assembly factor 1
MVHSGLQRSVLSLYRKALKVARSKPLEFRQANEEYVKRVFREDAASVRRTDFRTIEFMVRMGEKKVKLVAAPDVSRIGNAASLSPSK